MVNNNCEQEKSKTREQEYPRPMNTPEQIKQDADDAARAGQFETARDLYMAALSERPDWGAVHNNLVMVQRHLGNADAAEHHFRDALNFDPQQVGALSNLGALLVEQDRLVEAAPVLDQAKMLAPDHPGVLYNWALLAAANQEFAAAIPALEKSISLNPNYAQAHSNLGVALRKTGRLEDAVQTLTQALKLNPNLAEAHINLAATLSDLGEVDVALAAGLKAVALDPDSAEAHYNLGNAYNKVPDFEQALEQFDHALVINPQHAEAENNRSRALWSLGRPAESVQALRRVLTIKPTYAAAHSNIVFKLQYDPSQTPERLFAEARGWNTQHGQEYGLQYGTTAPQPSTLDPNKTLKVAYLSPHLKRHPVGFFVEPVLTHRNSGNIETVCYADMATAEALTDAITARLKATGVAWHHVHDLNHAALIERVRRDEIDILIDLDGHTGPNRLPVFAGRAAPIQVTWAGYVGTTGLDAMDYLITDTRQTVAADLPLMTEQPVYMLGNYVTVMPFADTPNIGPSPSSGTGYVTFGCFNTLDKINESVIACWAKIMTAVPDSRMRLITFDLGDASVRLRIAGLFEQHGVSPDRLDLQGKIPRLELLEAYNTLDIALDPFPYSGGLTTLEALWMGVPVITKRDGDRFASRHSMTHLTAVGVIDCIAENAEDYVTRAIALADDATRREHLRSTLREAMRTSPACDGTAFTRALEKAYRLMWQRYCAGEAPSPIPEDLLK